MPSAPWWLARVTGLLEADAPGGQPLGPLWRMKERLAFVRANLVPAELEVDLSTVPGARATWAAFEAREREVETAFAHAGEQCAAQLRSGALGKAAFRAGWEQLGYEAHGDSGGTPADDYLDGLLHLSRHTEFERPAPLALLNLATRASRVADFLSVTAPAADDVVFDLGSGSGKLAITVAASASTSVLGVEIERAYAAEARRSSTWLGLENVAFETADVRDVDLSRGSIFYLYYPFHGALAQEVARRLGALARDKDITIYAAGPALEFGEHFLAEVAGGSLSLTGRRGEFGEVLLLESRRA